MQVPIGAVTNGVHMPTWLAPEMRSLLRRYVGPDWWDLDGKDGRWEAVYEIPADVLWNLHLDFKRRLLDIAKTRAEHVERLGRFGVDVMPLLGE